MNNIAVFISGRGSNFIKLYENIESGHIKNGKISVVFSNKTDAQGLEFAKEKNIPVITLDIKDFKSREDFDKEIVKAIEPYKIDLICLAGYMRIVTKELVNAYPNKILNIHPALLPSFPGLHSQKQALDYGVKVSGCTVHFVDCGLDSGPIILQRVVPVYSYDTEDTISSRILKEEHIAYSIAVDLFCNNKLKVNGRIVEIEENKDDLES